MSKIDKKFAVCCIFLFQFCAILNIWIVSAKTPIYGVYVFSVWQMSAWCEDTDDKFSHIW